MISPEYKSDKDHVINGCLESAYELIWPIGITNIDKYEVAELAIIQRYAIKDGNQERIEGESIMFKFK